MTDIQQHQEYNNQLEMLMQREQLMEDIDCIIEEYFQEYGITNDPELVKILCDAVCRNFPSNWLWKLKLNYTLVEKFSPRL